LQVEHIGSELSSEYGELKQQYDHWRRRHHAGLALIFIGFIAPYVLLTLVLAATDLNSATIVILLPFRVFFGLPSDMTALYESFGKLVTSSMRLVLVGSLGIIVVCVPLGSALVLQSGKRLTPIEMLFIRFYDVTSLVQKSFDRKLSEKNRAFKMLGEVIDHIEDEWEIPEEISSFVDGRDIADFRKNLSTRLLGGVKDGNEKSLGALIQINKALLNPGLESLTDLNSWMQNNLPISEIAEQHGILRHFLSGYLTPNRVHIAVLIASGLVGAIFHWVCLNMLGVSKDTSIIAAVTVFGILFGGYLAKTRK
jgi:hypothetical protein